MQVEHVYLTGYTAAPPRKEIEKTALGAESWIPWSTFDDAKGAIDHAREEGFQIVALEKTASSQDISTFMWPEKACLILGHEIDGVEEELLKESDAVVHIPMLGKKESLNVSVAAGIALHEGRHTA